jgi:hypothetical protein
MATSLVGSTAHGQNRSLAKEFTINDMHEAVRIGRAGADNSPRSSELFPLCFPQGFPHYPQQNRSANGGSFDAFLLRATAYLLRWRRSVWLLRVGDLTPNPPHKCALMPADTLSVCRRRHRRSCLVRRYALDTTEDRRHLITVGGPYRHVSVQVRGA